MKSRNHLSEVVLGGVADHLAQMPLERTRIEAAGRNFVIESVSDQDSLVAAADGLVAFPFGLMLWESAAVLADRLAAWPGGLTGRRVLEIGAGVGLSGLAARALGGNVVQTDHSAEALELCRRNAVLNGVAGIEQRLGDWTDWRSEDRFDLVIGSDVLYDAGLHSAVRAVFEKTLKPGGTVVLTDPGRSTTPEFIACMERDGWTTRKLEVIVPALKPSRDGELVTVSVFEVRHL